MLTLAAFEHGICQLRHLTVLSMNGTRHDLHRELLLRMLVSALPLLVRLDLSIDLVQESVGIAVDTHTIVHIPEKLEPHPTTSFLNILGGKFSHGIATLDLSGRTTLHSQDMRQLLLFEASTLTSLNVSRCNLKDPGMVIQSIATCSRLKTLNLAHAFHDNAAFVPTAEIKFPKKIQQINVQGVPVMHGSDAFVRLMQSCPCLQSIASDWAMDDRCWAMLADANATNSDQATSLKLCLSRTLSATQCSGLTKEGWHQSMNTGTYAEQLKELSIGQGVPVDDSSLMITLSLATRLETLHLNRCTRLSDRCLQRFGEGLGLVGVFCKDPGAHSVDILNATIARIG